MKFALLLLAVFFGGQDHEHHHEQALTETHAVRKLLIVKGLALSN